MTLAESHLLLPSLTRSSKLHEGWLDSDIATPPSIPLFPPPCRRWDPSQKREVCRVDAGGEVCVEGDFEFYPQLCALT